MNLRNGLHLQTENARLLTELLAAVLAIGISAACAAAITLSLGRQIGFPSKNHWRSTAALANQGSAEWKKREARALRLPSAASNLAPRVASSVSPLPSGG